MSNKKISMNINHQEKVKSNAYRLNEAKAKTEHAREHLRLVKEEVVKAVEALNFALVRENEILEESNRSLSFMNDSSCSSFSTSSVPSSRSLPQERHCEHARSEYTIPDYVIPDLSPLFTSKKECSLGGFTLGEFSRHHTPDKTRSFVTDEEKAKRFKL